jgi:hypothetical protein
MNSIPKTFWSSADGLELLEQIYSIAANSDFEPGKTALQAKASLACEPTAIAEGIELVLGREKSKYLGGWAANALISRNLLEQCSRPEVSRHHAKKFAGCEHVLEIGTGVGIDTAALASVAKKVTSIELDPETAARAEYNLKLQSIANVDLLAGDATEIVSKLEIHQFDGLWADPARRSAGVRVRDPALYGPPLPFLMQLDLAKIGIKVSPALHMSPVDGWEREFIGFGHECLEQTLWHGADIRDGDVTLVDKEVAFSQQEHPGEVELIQPTDSPSGFLL